MINKWFKEACILANIDLTHNEYKHNGHIISQEEVNDVFEKFKVFLHEKTGENDTFHIQSSKSTTIILKRDKSAPCLLSGRVHDNSAAFLTVHEDGSIYFHCFRGCTTGCPLTNEQKTSLKINKSQNIAVAFNKLNTKFNFKNAVPANNI